MKSQIEIIKNPKSTQKELPDRLGAFKLNDFLTRIRVDLERHFKIVEDDIYLQGSSARDILGFSPEKKEESIEYGDNKQDIDLSFTLPVNNQMPLYQERIWLEQIRDCVLFSLLQLSQPPFLKEHKNPIEFIKKHYLTNLKIVPNYNDPIDANKNLWLLMGIGNLEIKFPLRIDKHIDTTLGSFEINISEGRWLCSHPDLPQAIEDAKNNFLRPTSDVNDILNPLRRMFHRLSKNQCSYNVRESLIPFCQNAVNTSSSQEIVDKLMDYLDNYPLASKKQPLLHLFHILQAFCRTNCSQKMKKEILSKTANPFKKELFRLRRNEFKSQIPSVLRELFAYIYPYLEKDEELKSNYYAIFFRAFRQKKPILSLEDILSPRVNKTRWTSIDEKKRFYRILTTSLDPSSTSYSKNIDTIFQSISSKKEKGELFASLIEHHNKTYPEATVKALFSLLKQHPKEVVLQCLISISPTLSKLYFEHFKPNPKRRVKRTAPVKKPTYLSKASTPPPPIRKQAHKPTENPTESLSNGGCIENIIHLFSLLFGREVNTKKKEKIQ